MKTTLSLALLTFVFHISTGCATILSGKTEEISIRSFESVVVEVDGVKMQTPAFPKLDRRHRHILIFPDGIRVDTGHSSFGNPAVILNCLLVPLSPLVSIIGIIVDLGSGANKDIEPDDLLYVGGCVFDLENFELLGRKPFFSEYEIGRLLLYLSGSEPAFQAWAARILGHLPEGRGAIPQLQDLAENSPDRRVRSAARDALEDLED